MNNLINRLFSKGETEEVTILNENRSYRSLLKHFYNKGNSSKKLEELRERCDNFFFNTQPYLSHFELVRLYLDIEYYLIVIDSGFIGSGESLRGELRKRFPEIANTVPFAILYDTGNKQEIGLGSLLADYMYRSLKVEHPEIRSSAPSFIIDIVLNTKESDPLTFISNRRKVREYLAELLNAYTTTSGTYGVPNSYEIFCASFRHLKVSKQLSYFLPDAILTTLPKEESEHVKKQVAAKASNTQIQPKVDGRNSSFFNAVFENIIDGFMVFNQNGNLLETNTTARKIFNIERSKIEEYSIFDLLPFSFSTHLKNEMLKQVTMPNRKIIGKTNEVELSREAMLFEISITNNYTEEDQTYTILLKNISDNRETISSIQAEKENAKRSAEAKTTFLSNMSHEIRTPLNVILGLSDLIKKSDNQDVELFRKNLDGIDFSARNLLSIVNDILDFSKIDAGKLTIQAYDFNIKEVITSLTDGFAMKASEKGVQVITDIDLNIPEIVVGDQYRLNQILTNLVGNALKFTKEGSITVTVKKQAAETDQLYFEVKDTGIGIPGEKLPHIFDSFYQVEGSENSKINGTGLGLAITTELIKLQNGQINARSTVGEGSTFSFTLPLQKSDMQKAAEAKPIADRCDSQLEGMRVLVAEDNRMNQFYIEQLLSRLNIEVDIAENGKEALDTYNEKGKGFYDLILMDMHMPIMNGTEAIYAIRKSHKNALKKVPIVMCSADVFPEARKDAMKAGIDFYLTKPLSEDALKEVLFWLVSDTSKIASSAAKGIKEDTSRSNRVNIEQLSETFDGDEDFIITLLEVFIQDTPDDFNSLRTCMERDFYPRASKLAHKMKSNFMNLGMTNHGYHLQQIESNINRPETTASAREHWIEFQRLYTKSLTEVNLLLIELKMK